MKCKPSKQWKQGTYRPINPEKYIGKSAPTYRSSWELKVFTACDRNPNILRWVSEGIVIPYASPIDHKMHRYYPDIYMEVLQSGKVKKYLIEIKPQKQTKPPKKHGNKKQTTMLYESLEWSKNKAKWDAANQWAKHNGCVFKLITEMDIFN